MNSRAFNPCAAEDSLSPSYNECLCANSPFYAWQIHEKEYEDYRILYWYHPSYGTSRATVARRAARTSTVMRDLGHNEYITDMSGLAFQYFHFSAFSRRDFEHKPIRCSAMLARPSPAKMRGGETLVQDAANYSKFDAPYRFNAKELDQEPSEGSSRTPLKNKTKREQTGNYYYGAPSRRDFEHKPTRRSAMLARPSHAFQREYYNPTWSVWLSVDPLSSQSPSQTPYHFASNNPIMRVDPDGLTDLENSETGEIVTVNDGMNQTVLIEANNWGEAVDFSHLEDGNNPSSAYNSFISNSGGVSVPTETSGGMIPNKEMFLGFMEFKIKNEEKEVAAFKAKDGSGYHFGPWKGNKTDSFNSTALVEDYASSIGYGKDDISEIHHTHPNGLANPSLSDAYLSYQLGGTPVFSMGESPFNKNLIEIHKATPRYFTQSEREYLKHRPLPMNLNLYGKKVDY